MAHNGGQLQVNVNFANQYYEGMALNVCKTADVGFVPSGGSPGTDWAALIGPSGLPTAMPAGGALWRQGQCWIYGAVGDTWDLYYPTTKTMHAVHSSGGTITETLVEAGHSRYEIATVVATGIFINCAIFIDAMADAVWGDGISFHKTEHQALVDAGEYFDPLFLARYGYGSGKTPFGMIRTMNWGGGPSMCKLDSHRHEVTDHSWMAPLHDSRYFAGTATKVLNHYTTGSAFPGSPVAWTDGQPVEFWMATRPSKLAITAVTMGATTSFQCVGHGLTTGEEIEPSLNAPPTGQLGTAMTTKSSTTGLTPVFAVTKTDDDNFTIAINSTGFSAVTSCDLLPVITVTDGTLAAKRCISRSMEGQYYSSWSSFASGGIASGAYHEEFDAIVMRGIQGALTPMIPVEIQCALANKLDAYLWICIPTYFKGAEERAYIQRVKDNANLRPGFEKANEIWNFQNMPYNYATSLAAIRATTLSPKVGHGIMVDETAANVATVMGASDYKMIMGHQNISTYAAQVDATKCGHLSGYVNEGTPGTASLYPLNKCDVLAVAPYVRVNFSTAAWLADDYVGWVTCLQNWLAGDEATAYNWFNDEMITASAANLGNNEQLTDHVNSGLTGFVDKWVDVPAEFTGRQGNGIEIWGYEGMEHNVGADHMDGGFPTGGVEVSDIDDFMQAYKRSIQYGWLSGRILSNLKDAGMVWPSVYTAAGPWDSAGMWGQWPTDNMLEDAPPGWTVLYNLNRNVKTVKLVAS